MRKHQERGTSREYQSEQWPVEAKGLRKGGVKAGKLSHGKTASERKTGGGFSVKFHGTLLQKDAKGAILRPPSANSPVRDVPRHLPTCFIDIMSHTHTPTHAHTHTHACHMSKHRSMSRMERVSYILPVYFHPSPSHQVCQNVWRCYYSLLPC